MFARLKGLRRERERLKDEINRLKNQRHADEGAVGTLPETLRCIGHRLQLAAEHIAAVEQQIRSLIAEDEQLIRQFGYVCSIKGVGLMTAATVVGEAHGFSMTRNARQLVSYAGSAPFPNQSGNIKNPDRVSEWRCVRLKTLLLNGVHSAIQYDPELRAYYQRKCGEGKHPKSVKNAVVCKLLYRVFAVINRGTPYVKLYEQKTTTIA